MRQWRVHEAMTTDVVRVDRAAGYQQIADLLVQHRISAVPVVDSGGVVVGVVSEADLLPKLGYPEQDGLHPLVTRRRRAAARRVGGDSAGDLMTSPAIVVLGSAPVAAAARLMEESRVKRLPVVDEAGRLIGIVSRRDLVRLYARPDEAIRGDVVDLILNGFWVDPSTVDIGVVAGVVTLSGAVDRTSTARILARAAHTVPGVVDVVDRLTGEYDDSATPNSSLYRGHTSSTQPRGIAR